MTGKFENTINKMRLKTKTLNSINNMSHVF